MNCDKWFYTCLALIALVFAGLLMIFKYFLKIDRNSVKLGQADKQHEYKHILNEQRIKVLESLNEGLQKEISKLKQIISEKNQKNQYERRK